jgi:hypothetical protein
MMINQPDILNQIYRVITTTPQILTADFIEELLTTVLPIAESNVDNDTLEKVTISAQSLIHQSQL